MRIEKDCVGKLEVPDDALYGINSLRAARNFPITKEKVDPLLIESYVQIKKLQSLQITVQKRPML
ncbi:Fumarate hydratase class II [Apilactobacillus kunkeei]|nr:Fumarate hydratase class II [Apilactobacillus kunkeei]CAI2603963.1 Fumarate hydratase class II [Apilactobacillus kunkeei]